MAAIAIAVSFFVIIVAVAVGAGFRHSIREGVQAMVGDIRIAPFSSGGGDPVSLPRHLPSEEALKALDGVRELVPSVTRAGIVKSGDLVHGVLVKGVPDGLSVTPGEPSVIPGSHRESLPVSIPHRLSEITGLGPGEDLTIYFVGEKVRVRRFHITAVHRDVLELDDNLLVRARLEDLQRLNGWDEDQVSAVDVLMAPGLSRAQVERTALQAGVILAASGSEEEENLYAASSTRTYPQVFDWLELLDFNVVIILILMTVVAGFNMVSGLLIMLLRNIATVGTLKTLGMDNRGVGRLFVRIGAEAALKGMLIGNALALLFCLIQGTTHLIPLDPANYFVAWVPVYVHVGWILLADAAAFLGILVLLWLPTLVIARIDPAATVKAD